MADVEVIEFAGGGLDQAVDFADVAVHSLLQGVHEMVHFRVAPFHDQFDPPIT